MQLNITKSDVCTAVKKVENSTQVESYWAHTADSFAVTTHQVTDAFVWYDFAATAHAHKATVKSLTQLLTWKITLQKLYKNNLHNY